MGSPGYGNWISDRAVRACMAHYNRAEVHMMKIKFPLTGDSCARMLLSTWPLLSVNMTGRWCEWGICSDLLPLVGFQKQSSPCLVCRWTFCFCFLFFSSIRPSPAVGEKKKNTIPFVISPAIWGWISEFHLWSCERHSCSLGSLIRIPTDGILLLSLVFPPHCVIYLFVLGLRAQGVGSRTQDQQKIICFGGNTLKSFP